MSEQGLRVMVVDDHSVVREGLVALINLEDDMAVVGQSGTLREAEAIACQTMPDVIVLDLYLKDGTSIDCLRQLRSAAGGASVLVLSSFGNDEFVYRALEAGASGYLLKSAEAGEVLDAIKAVANGHTWVSSELAGALVRQMGRASLTERERDVLMRIAAGRSNEEISSELSVALSTVKTHVHRIMTKLEARSRIDAVVKARKVGILPP